MKQNSLYEAWEKNKIKFEVMFKAILTWIAFSLDYVLVSDEIAEQGFIKIYSILPKLVQSFLAIDKLTVENLILLCFFLWFYYVGKAYKGKKNKISCIVLSIFISLCFVIGEVIYRFDELEILFKGSIQAFKTVLIIAGYSIFFFQVILVGIVKYDAYMKRNKLNGSQFSFFDGKYAYLILVGILIIAWLPTMIAYYPAMFMGDTEDIIYMAFNYPTGIINGVNLINEKVYLVNHHPVVYTKFLGIVLSIVRKCGGTDNFGIFLCALSQYVINAFILAYSCIYCARGLKKYKLAVYAMCFYIFCPWIPKYVIMLSKDTLFADFILLFGIKLHQILTKKNKGKQYIYLVMFATGVFLFRKNGVYVVVLTFLMLCVIYRKYWKQWLICLSSIALLYIGYFNVILPIAEIPDGSVREALSIPFQQTARYVKYHEDEVTEQERQAIDAILEYEVIGDVYDSNLSDPVKATYRKDADKQDLMNYFKAWFAMLWKHPETYIAATLNNYYGYFYPIVNDGVKLYRTSVGSMANANRDGYFLFENSYDELHMWLRDFITFYDIIWMKLPILNVFMTSACYVWLVIMGGYLKLLRGDKAGGIICFMYVTLILTALAGPCNAINYERYIFACILGLPFIVSVILHEKECTEGRENGRNLSISTDTVL